MLTATVKLAIAVSPVAASMLGVSAAAMVSAPDTMM